MLKIHRTTRELLCSGPYVYIWMKVKLHGKYSGKYGIFYGRENAFVC